MAQDTYNHISFEDDEEEVFVVGAAAAAPAPTALRKKVSAVAETSMVLKQSAPARPKTEGRAILFRIFTSTSLPNIFRLTSMLHSVSAEANKSPEAYPPVISENLSSASPAPRYL